jgi:hypothetical protein
MSANINPNVSVNTTLASGVATALAIAPNASGGFSTLRKYSGSASLNDFYISAGQTTYLNITVTSAAAGDTATIDFPYASDQGQACVAGIVCSTNTVTVYLYAAPNELGLPADAQWSGSGNTAYASIIK